MDETSNKRENPNRKPLIHPEWFAVGSRIAHSEDGNHKLLDTIPLFRDLSPGSWRELTSMFHKRRFEAGEVIFQGGTPGMGMYIIVSGEVRITGPGDRNDVELAILCKGDFFGEMSLIDEVDRSASATAVEPTQLIGIFRPQLEALMQRRPKLGLLILTRLAKIISLRLREANEQLALCRAELDRSQSNE